MKFKESLERKLTNEDLKCVAFSAMYGIKKEIDSLKEGANLFRDGDSEWWIASITRLRHEKMMAQSLFDKTCAEV